MVFIRSVRASIWGNALTNCQCPVLVLSTVSERIFAKSGVGIALAGTTSRGGRLLGFHGTPFLGRTPWGSGGGYDADDSHKVIAGANICLAGPSCRQSELSGARFLSIILQVGSLARKVPEMLLPRRRGPGGASREGGSVRS